MTHSTTATTSAVPHKACCSIPPVKSDYSPKGAEQQIAPGLDAYVVGPSDAKHQLIVVYDIFGFHPATKQTVDLISEGLCARIVMPDFFHGKPWPLSDFPPSDPKKMGDWMASAGSWDKTSAVIQTALKYVRDSGATEVGLVGFCWGGKMVALASDKFAKDIKGFAMLHPYMADEHDAEKAQGPWCCLASKDEPDMSKAEKVMASKPFGNLSVFRRFDDMHHGWCGARADYKNEHNRKRTHEAIELAVNFFSKVL